MNPQLTVVVETFVDDISISRSESKDFRNAETDFYSQERNFETLQAKAEQEAEDTAREDN